MKKANLFLLLGLMSSILTFPGVEGAFSYQANTKENRTVTKAAISTIDEEDEEYDLLERDEIDNTDAFAIPFDDSEIEDEEEINRIEGKDIFNLPHNR
jgi:hypothetical protein